MGLLDGLLKLGYGVATSKPVDDIGMKMRALQRKAERKRRERQAAAQKKELEKN